MQKPVAPPPAPATSASSGAEESPAKGEAGEADAASGADEGGGEAASEGSDKDKEYDLSSWGGKTPKMMLLEWFQKRQQPRPKIDVVSEGRRFRGIVTVQDGLVYELPEGETFDKRDGAEQASATFALLQLFSDQPLYRLLPPAYRSLWLKWSDEAAAPEKQEAAAALVARDKFITRLCERSREPSEPQPKRRSTGAEAAGEVASPLPAPLTADEMLDEAAAARARQEARDADDEREAMEEERREQRESEQKARAEQDGVRLQVAYERWRDGEEGQKAHANRKTLPVHQMEGSLRAAMLNGQVAIVCGETGSGKSTQVPQMLLEESLINGKGGTTSIICTQPRRIAATSLAQRVANERGERAGERGSQIGYQVRLSSS